MIARYHGRKYSLQRLRDISGISRDGVSLLGISQASEKIGFRSTGIKTNIETLAESELPCILHWRKNHFVVLYKVSGRSVPSKRVFHIADPASGLLTYKQSEFAKNWISTRNNDEEVGVALILTPTPEFFEQEGDPSHGLSLTYILGYLAPYKKLIIQLVAGLATGSLLQLILPFIMQSVVDIGINTRNINFVSIILIAQTMLFIGRLSVDFIRSWILLHISTRINISILTDFLIKIFKLPISFFETKMTGDIMQRMEDQGRIQSFLTGSSLGTIFSLFNLIVFAFVLAYYNFNVFTVFLISSVLYSLWVMVFLRKRRMLDFKRFDISSENQSNIVQLISGMQEIKLNNCEQQKRWQWEHIQAKLFKYNIKSLALGQYQQLGAFFINEGKNIIITFMVARAVIDGQLTLGGMMAIQYIVGQLNSPIEQLVSFLQAFQDAKISLERLNEVHSMQDEEPADQQFINVLPASKSISLHDITFSYPGASSEPILQGVSLEIPEGKTTAIVGMSGSGKTTLLKLLLRFHETIKGEIRIGNTSLSQISYRYWRGVCGAVMQDGFIFSDTIANNIAVADERLDIDRLKHAIYVANIREFIDDLPLGLNTKIGAAGNGISQGQRQRILIARAVYKNPEYIFFDEATNALDANNEKVIIENLDQFFTGRTVVIVAHRLSTVKNADNIVVLDKGMIIEQGNHQDLTALKGEYFKLVKNQLELGD
jgi:ATP-binding cassette subfamily B protein